jgi:hypothetical protein
MSDNQPTKTISLTSDDDINLLKDMLKYIGIEFDTLDDLYDMTIPREVLLREDTIGYYNGHFKEKWKSLHYRTDKLTSLRNNNLTSQRYPAVNMLRQILRCHKLHMKPHVTSMGYDAKTGRKLYKRDYIIGRVYSFDDVPEEDAIADNDTSSISAS